MDEELSLNYIQTVRYLEGHSTAKISKGCRYTALDVTSSYLAVGTHSGSVVLYYRKTGRLQKLHCDIAVQEVTCIRCLESVDLLIAIGTATGLILVFQYLPERDQMERYLINEVHSQAVKCLEWNQNGVKLFSGDKSGIVALTEMDYLMHLSKSVVLYNENYPIVQIDYHKRLLLVSTELRSFLAVVGQDNSVVQVGMKERKSLGNYGALFYVCPDKTDEVRVFASRPALRLWKANCQGKVLETFVFKDNSTPSCQVLRVGGKYTSMGIHSPHPELQFGPLKVFMERYLLTWSFNRLMLLAVGEPSMVAKCDEFRDVRGVCSSGDEIYVLDGFRRITRIACSPDKTYTPSNTDVSRDSFKFMPNALKTLESNIKSSSSLINKIIAKSTAIVTPSRTNEDNEAGNMNLEDKVEFSALETPQFVISDLVDQVDGASSLNLALDNMWSPVSDGDSDDEDVSGVVFKRLPGNRTRPRGEPMELKPIVLKDNRELTVEETRPGDELCNKVELSSETSPMPKSREEKELYLAQKLNMFELAPSFLGPPDSTSLSSSAEPSPAVDTFLQIPFQAGNSQQSKVYDEPSESESAVDDSDSVQPSFDSYPDIYTRSNISIESYLSYGPPSGSSIPNQNSLSEAGSIPPLHLTVPAPEPKQEPLKLVCPPPPQAADRSPSSSMTTSSHSPERLNGSQPHSPTVSYNDTWVQHKPPAQIQSLAVCDTYMVCTDTKDVVYYCLFEGLGLEWHKTEYPAKQISIAPSGKRVWRIYNHSAYALCEPSIRGPFGSRWWEVALDVLQISVHESCVWHVTVAGELYCQTGLKLDQTYVALVNVVCPSKIASVSCNSSSVLALTMEGELLWRTDIDEEYPTGKNWQPIKLDHGHVFAATLGNSVTSWIVDEAFDIWFLSTVKSKSKSSKSNYKWWQVKISDYIYQSTSALKNLTNTLMDSLCSEQLTQLLGRMNTGNACLVCTESRGIWFYNPSDHILLTNQREIVGHSWDQVDNGKIAGIRWKALTASGVYHHHGGIWLWSKREPDMVCFNTTSTLVSLVKPPPLAEGDRISCLNAAPDAVWLLTQSGRIFIRKDITATNSVGSKWVELDLTQITHHKLVHVCCGSNLVWAVDSKGVVLMRIGSLQVPSIRNFPPAWVVVDEEGANANLKTLFTKVYVGPLDYIVWAIDNKNNVYVREGIFPEILIGVGWVLVSGVQAESLAISEKSVYALTPSKTIYRRYNISRNNYIGDYWKELPGKARQLSVTVDDKLWALGLDNQLTQHSTCQVFAGYRPRTYSKGSVGEVSIDDDWEVV